MVKGRPPGRPTGCQQDLKTEASPCTLGSIEGPRYRLKITHLMARPATQQFPNTPHNHSSNRPVLFFLKKKRRKKKKKNQPNNKKAATWLPRHWACVSVGRPVHP